jgi:hypothetical protein
MIRLELGLGAMTEWKEIVQIVVDRFGLHLSINESDGTI